MNKNILVIGTLVALAGASVYFAENVDMGNDLIIYGGTVYDGSGGEGYKADIAIKDDRIVKIGDLSGEAALNTIDATGKAVSPGFVNMLSWAPATLLVDGRGMSDIKQGVTLEVFGEGNSWGPWSEETKQNVRDAMGDLKYDVEWNTLGEYFDYAVAKGISPNIASFVGATTVRVEVLGRDDVKATPEQIIEMQDLVRGAMEDGALGVGSSLIYAPAKFADTAELIALNKAAAEYGGMYISHMRSEGPTVMEAIDELITISREAGVPAEIYHLKASGKTNWGKLEEMFAKIEAARAEGLRITADMYTYPASSTGLDAAMPVWVQAGGYEKWRENLLNPEIRAKVLAEMLVPQTKWSNVFFEVGAEGIMIVGTKNPDLKPYIGRRLSDIANEWGLSPQEAAIELVVRDGSRVQVVYFSMTEENMPKKVAKPWVSFGSDAGALATEGVFIKNSTHPRAYGTFARVLGKYVREEKVITLGEAIRKMAAMPAQNIGARDRGMLKVGYYADVVVFDPDTVTDHATFEKPHQYATGVDHVVINGVQVLKDGEHTGATPGRAVRGPGWRGWKKK
jgi:N-acyl-D-amino-acid deacylase